MTASMTMKCMCYTCDKVATYVLTAGSSYRCTCKCHGGAK